MRRHVQLDVRTLTVTDMESVFMAAVTGGMVTRVTTRVVLSVLTEGVLEMEVA